MANRIFRKIVSLNQEVSNLYQQQAFQQAFPRAKEAYKLAQKHLAKDDIQSALSTYHYAELNRIVGDVGLAESLFHESLASMKQISGEKSLDYSQILFSLSTLYVQLGQFSESISLTEKALDIETELLGPTHKRVIQSLQSLHLLNEQIGETEQALSYFTEWVNRLESALGEEEYYEFVEELLQEAISDNHTEKSIILYQKKGDILLNLYGEKHETYAQNLNNMGAAYYQQRQYGLAESTWKKTLELAISLYGEDSEATATSKNNLSTVNIILQKYAEAEPYLKDAIRIMQNKLGEQHPSLATMYINLGSIYVQTGRFAAAEAIFQQSLNIRLQLFAPNDPEMQALWDRLVFVYQKLGKWDVAENILLQKINISQAEAPFPSRQHLENLRNLGQLYKDWGNIQQAEAYWEKLRDLYEANNHLDRRELIKLLDDLATLYQKEDDFEKAEQSYKRAIQLLSSMDMITSHAAMALREKLADVLVKKDHFEQALSLYTENKKHKEKLLGEWHPETIAAAKKIAEFYRLTGQSDLALSYYEPILPFYMERGEWGPAEDVAKEILSIHRRISEENSIQIAYALGNLAEIYRRWKHFEPAKPLYEEALKIFRMQGMERTIGGLTIINNYGLWLANTGKNEEAHKYFTEALEGWRTLNELNHGMAFTLNNLADVKVQRREYKEAEELLLESLALRKILFGEQSYQYATVLSNLGRLYTEMGNYIDAENYIRFSIQCYQASVGESHPLYAGALNHLAKLYWKQDKKKESENLLRLVLTIHEQTNGANSPEYALTQNDLAEILRLGAFYGEAEQLLLNALKILGQYLGPTNSEYVMVQNNLANLYQEINNFDRAEEILLRNIDLLAQNQDKDLGAYETLLNNLGNLYHRSGRYFESIKVFEEALEMRKKAGGDNHPDTAQSMNNFAASLTYIQPAYAQALLRQALSIYENSLGKEHPWYAQALNNLSYLLATQGQHEEAIRLQRESNLIYEQSLGKGHPEYLTGRQNLAHSLIIRGDIASAYQIMLECEDHHDRLIGTIFSMGSEAHRLRYLRKIQVQFYSFLALVVDYMGSNQDAIRAAFELSLKRKAILTESMMTQRLLILAGRYPDLRPQLEQLSDLRDQIAQKELIGSIKEGLQWDQKLLEDWKKQKDELEKELNRQIPEMAIEEVLLSTHLDELVDLLPEKAAVVEFIRMESLPFAKVFSPDLIKEESTRYVAFILHADQALDIQLIDLGNAGEMEKLVGAFRRNVVQKKNDRGQVFEEEGDRAIYQESANALKKRLLEPLYPFIKECKHLFISPDGTLNRLPFEVLPTTDNGFLFESFQISYLATARDLMRLAPSTRRKKMSTSPLIIGDPDFDLNQTPGDKAGAQGGNRSRHSRSLLSEDLRFNPLPGTRQEALTIADMLDVNPLLGPVALEGLIKDQRSPRILHLATHGFFLQDQGITMEDFVEFDQTFDTGNPGRLSGLPENPMLRSGLALAGANTWLSGGDLPPQAEDALLTGEDVVGLDLLDTELVVLSACDTGLGEIQVGEGVLGLRRAFILAGADTLIMSLWKVPDEQTQELMVEFYRQLIGGKGPAAALRNAQLFMKEKYPDPFFWAAFICHGNPGLPT